MSTPIPAEVTSAALAGILGLSERRVAALRGEGRLPVTPGGRIDLSELLRRGWAASLARGQPGAEPAAEGFTVAAALALREAPIGAVLAAAEGGIPRAQAERLADLAALFLWSAMNRQRHALGLPAGDGDEDEDEDDPQAWREAVNWPALFDAEGRSIVAGRMAAATADEAGGGQA